MAALQSFFYDAQIERFLAQFIRMFSGFQVEFGLDRNGHQTLQRVPVYYGDGSRQVAAIITQNTAPNIMNSVPAMTVYIKNLSYDRERIQDPTFVGTMNIRQRAYNESTQEYENRQGNAFTIERQMPVPYVLELVLDIWTSNTKQKLQLIEQIQPLFNPGLEIQSTDNYIDWTSLSVVYLESVNWSSRSVPIGTDNPVDVASMTFKLPIWLTLPAKVKKLGVVQSIIASVFNAEGDLSTSVLDNAMLLGNRMHFTPLNYGILLYKNTLTLLKQQDLETPRDINGQAITGTPVKIGTKDNWKNLVNLYGNLQNGVSQVRISSDDGSTLIMGTVSYHPTDDSVLIYNPDIDTLPTNTLTAITAIIDPTKETVDATITNPTTGTRYLILHAIGSGTTAAGDGPSAWHGIDNTDLVANSNDIIEYNGSHWFVSFDSQAATSIQYVSNLNTGIQYKWTLNQWVKSYEGEYKAGLWNLIL
jgi:hypothetical protein